MAFPTKMKPETIARRKREHKAESEARTRDLRQRMQESVNRDGPDSFYAELLAEMDERARLENS